MSEPRPPADNALLDWETPWPCDPPELELEMIEPFNARGMRPVYGRTDAFPGHPHFHLDMWWGLGGRTLLRFWQRGIYAETVSFELRGVAIPPQAMGRPLLANEELVPALVRRKLDEWVRFRLEYPDCDWCGEHT